MTEESDETTIYKKNLLVTLISGALIYSNLNSLIKSYINKFTTNSLFVYSILFLIYLTGIYSICYGILKYALKISPNEKTKSIVLSEVGLIVFLENLSQTKEQKKHWILLSIQLATFYMLYRHY